MRSLVILLAAGALPAAAQAAFTVQTGTLNGMAFTAQSFIIGQGSTATVAGGGSRASLALAPAYRGVVGLLIDEGAAGQFVCSGSLSADRGSIITAGHCVSDGSGARPVGVTAYFYNPVQPDPDETPVYMDGAPNVTKVAVDRISVNPLYTGEVIDDHDIAVLHLGAAAPAFANGYDLYTGGDLTGVQYNVAGYGRRSDGGGSVGADLGTGRLRQGDNRYDFRLGDRDLGGVFAGGPNGFFGTAETDYSYLADFDDGTAAHDASCGLATGIDGLGLPVSDKYCNLGLGANEVGIAPGDSGGPQFVDGKLASVTSYGLSFGLSVQPGDVDDALNETFGEFNGFVPIFHNLDFVQAALLLPEPTSWATAILGLGLVGGALRRDRRGRAAAAA